MRHTLFWTNHGQNIITAEIALLTCCYLLRKWPSLEQQRLHTWLMLLFKILTNKLIVPSRCLPSQTPVQSTSAHHQLKLALRRKGLAWLVKWYRRQASVQLNSYEIHTSYICIHRPSIKILNLVLNCRLSWTHALAHAVEQTCNYHCEFLLIPTLHHYCAPI